MPDLPNDLVPVQDSTSSLPSDLKPVDYPQDLKPVAPAELPRLFGPSHAEAVANPTWGNKFAVGLQTLSGTIPESPVAQAMASFIGAKPQDRSAVGNATAAALSFPGRTFANAARATRLVTPVQGGPQPFQYDPKSASGQLGSGVGMLATTIPMGIVGAPVVAASMGQGATDQVAAARAAGKQISNTQANVFEVAKAAQGMIQALPIGGRSIESIETALTPYVGKLIAQWGPKAVVEGLGQVGISNAGDLVEKATVNPDKRIGEDAGQNFTFGSLGSLAHSYGESGSPSSQTPAAPDAYAAHANRVRGVSEVSGASPAESSEFINREAARPHTSPTLKDIRENLATARAGESAYPAGNVDEMHAARIAEEDTPKPEPTAEQTEAIHKVNLRQLHEDASTEPHREITSPTGDVLATRHDPVTGVASETAERLHGVERRETNTPQGTEGEQRRAEDTGGIPEHEFEPAVPPAPDRFNPKDQARETPSLFERIREKVAGPADTDDSKATALGIRSSLGKARLEGHNFEALATAAREHAPSYEVDPVSHAKWMDQVERGETPEGSHPDMVKFLKAYNEQRQTNAQDAVDIGRKNLDKEGTGFARMFQFPETSGEGKGTGSLAGTNDPFRSKQYDTYSEAAEAAAEHGGKPVFDNPLDAAVARQFQFAQNIEMVKNVRAKEQAGRATWVPEGTPAPDGKVALKDPIIGTETRKESSPSWKAGQIAKLPHFEAQAALDEARGQVKYTIPGPNLDLPDTPGHAFTGRETEGTYYMEPAEAAKYNNLIEKRNSGVLGGINKVAAISRSLQYSLNLGHAKAAIEAGRSSHLLEAGDRLLHGDIPGAVDSIKTALTGGGIVKGARIMRSIEGGTSGEVGRRIMDVNPFKDGQLRSVTNTDEHGLQAGIEAIRDGDTWEGVKKVVSASHSLTFNTVMPEILAGRLAARAESHIARGISMEDGRADMAKLADALNRQMGNHVPTPDYQNGPIRDLLETVIPAARLHEGNLRDIGHALAGNKYSLVPKLIGVGQMAAVSTALQYTMTYLNTGKGILPRSGYDLMNPYTGNKDENGRDIHLANMGTTMRVLNAVMHPIKYAEGIKHPEIRAVMELAANKNFEGNQVMPNDGSAAGNAARAVGHLAKPLLPINTDQAMGAHETEPRSALAAARDTAMSITGYSDKKAPPSPAQQELFDALHDKSETGGRNLEQQEQHDTEAKWVRDLKAGRSRDDVGQEMRDTPWMTRSIARSVQNRTDAPVGIASQVLDTAIPPERLSSAWDKATPEEQKSMKPFLIKRMEDEHPTSPLEMAKWKVLVAKVTGE